ncbi:tripartite tricarboxylate transporter permease [Desmospora activa]|uniref:Putative tricarboxylic transport membrane protein n=1 Tax=Desmospora activa DSM 45169 TaxID=1121389 RepID=A0A2T4ZBR8_9BACL|nr:tripartite tricarboxylate transporter permease [Desmospora activa]PTM59328.1 putative tricarboxylic transport membrane protein [Desmospora activa DSM 45169]
MVEAMLQVLSPTVLLYMILGVILGVFIGALPGLTSTMGVAIIVPLTFWLEPQEGMAMLIAVYCSSVFAGGIPAILINTPGTPAAISTTFDGYELAKQGRAKLALGINTLYSALGGIVSTVFLLMFAFPISRFALSFGPPEYFALAVFGLSIMISVSGASITKGLIAGGIGLFIATIGLDPMLSSPRFTFDQPDLLEGIAFIPMMIGLFGFGEVLYQMLNPPTMKPVGKGQQESGFPKWKEIKKMNRPFWLSSTIGTFIGAVPGAGGDIASMISWDQSRRISKEPERFGKGSLEGLAASSTANNAVIGGAFTTMLTLGLPGDTVTAILIGALMMYGMQPGPALFSENPDFVYVIIALLFVSSLMILLVGAIASNLFSRLMRLPREVIWIAVVVFSIVGAYALNNSYFDVWVMIISGFGGLLLRKLGFPLTPLILGLLLGEMAESNLRRAMMLTDQGWWIFFERPISLILIVLAAVSLLFPLIKRGLEMRKEANTG